MAIIKEINGKGFPLLKKGEIVTDGVSIFLKGEKGKIHKFIHKKRVLAMIEEAIAKHEKKYHKE